MKTLENIHVGIIGIGYIGLSLALEISKKYKVIAYDKSRKRIRELNLKFDSTNEHNLKKINTSNIKFTNSTSKLYKCNIYIIAVPTPVKKNQPDLQLTLSATNIVAKNIKKGDIVVYESTFYPGVTENICAVEIEKISKLKLNQDFFVGYSPERINPGDKTRTISKIKKITSGSSKNSATFIDKFYKTFIKAGTYKVDSIKIAEAAKVIENTQRDLNIALINEFSIIFDRLDIDTFKILDAANTKWNFINFQPGLVGGHCIGVDPYYLTYISKKFGYDPKIIDSGREVNDNYYKHVGRKILFYLNKKKNPRVLILGFTFKENCTDIRNTKIFDLYKLLSKKIKVEIHDELADHSKVKKIYNLKLVKKIKLNAYDLIVFPIKHKYIISKKESFYNKFLKRNGLIFDLKNIFKKSKTVIKI